VVILGTGYIPRGHTFAHVASGGGRWTRCCPRLWHRDVGDVEACPSPIRQDSRSVLTQFTPVI